MSGSPQDNNGWLQSITNRKNCLFSDWDKSCGQSKAVSNVNNITVVVAKDGYKKCEEKQQLCNDDNDCCNGCGYDFASSTYYQQC